MITNAFRMSRSEYVLGRPRGRLAGSDGQGSRSTRATKLTSRLVCRSISVPPQCGCVGTEILRGQPCFGDAWRGCFIYDHVSVNYAQGNHLGSYRYPIVHFTRGSVCFFKMLLTLS